MNDFRMAATEHDGYIDLEIGSMKTKLNSREIEELAETLIASLELVDPIRARRFVDRR